MIDWDFIHTLEGKHVLKGYVPTDRLGYPIGESGVTIGTGVDLGQLDRTDLVILLKHIPDSFNLIVKLNPYVGLKKSSAMSALLRLPLELTEEEATVLSKAMCDKTLRELKTHWNKYTHSDFCKLPSQVQTVLFSLAYNFGSNLEKALPHTWNVFTDAFAFNDWQGAYQWMLNFPSKNKELDKRRKKEAELLKELTAHQ